MAEASKKYTLNVPMIDVSTVEANTKKGDVVMEVHHKLEDGEGITGKFLGFDVREINDKAAPGGKKLIGVVCMEIKDPKSGSTMVARLTASHELESQMDGIPPGTDGVTIFRVGKTDIGNGQTVTRYAVQKPKAIVKQYLSRSPFKGGKVNPALAALANENKALAEHGVDAPIPVNGTQANTVQVGAK